MGTLEADIIESVINRQFKQAKEQLFRGVKTKPEALAARVAGVLRLANNDFYPADVYDTVLTFIRNLGA